MASTYARLLRNHPRVVNGCQGAVISTTGDLICQRWEGRTEVDVRRCAGAAAVGGFFSGLVYPAVYGALDKLWPGTSFRAVATKSVAELVPMGIGANALSIGWRAAVGGSSPSEVSARLKRLMPGVLLNEVRVWLPYNLLAFRFIPINIRPTSTAVVMLGWNVYLSHTSARDIPPEP